MYAVNNVIWTLKHPQMKMEMLGYIPFYLDERDPRSAREQFDTNYVGGWNPLPGFTLTETGLCYPGDPEMPLLAEARFRDEILRFYECSWLAVIQPDGSYEVCRMD